MTDERRKALEALERVRARWVEACDDHEPSLIEMRADVETIRRALTEPAVPDAVRELVHEFRTDDDLTAFSSAEDAANECADRLERALAQQGERVQDWRYYEDGELRMTAPEPDSGEGDQWDPSIYDDEPAGYR